MIPETIQVLIDRGAERIQQEWKRRDEEATAREREYTASVAGAWDCFEASAKAVLPNALHPFLRIERKQQMPDSWYEVAELQLEGLTPIRISLHKDGDGQYMPVEKMLIVAGIENAKFNWSYGNFYATADLEEALGLARLRFERLQKLQAEAEVEQARREAEYQEAERQQAENNARQQAEAQREMDTRQALFDSVSGDPVALAMLRVFAALQNERAEWEERLNQSYESSSALEFAYDRQLENVRAKESRAQQEAEDARRRAEDAEYELAQAKRNAR